MRTFRLSVIFMLLVMIIGVMLWSSHAFAGNIDPDNDGSACAYGENVGWINLNPTGGGVTVYDSVLAGFAWGENVGWINFNCWTTLTCLDVSYNVTNDGAGNLSGYAWGENIGWINFAPTGGGVTINPNTGVFSGKAWSENTGWISFDATSPVAFQVKTSWRGNQSPVANSQSVTTSEDTAKTITLTGSDADGDTLTYTVLTTPVNGTLTGTAPNLTYTPAANFNGSDNFTFKVNDGAADSNVATVSITVTSVNDPPVLNSIGSRAVNEGDTLTITVSGSDPDGGTLTYSATGMPSGATFNATTQTFDWTPAYTQSGIYNVTFTVSDGSLTDSEVVSVTVNNIDQTPEVRVDGAASGNQQSQTVAWNYMDREYMVLWQDFRNGSGNPDIYGVRLDKDGNRMTGDLPIVVQAAKQAGPWVSYGVEGYLAVWIDQRNSGTTGTDVYGAWILTDGTVSSEFVVTNASANQRAASVFYNPAVNNFLVTWTDDSNGASDVNIWGAILNPGGGISSGPFAMVTATGNQRGPYVRYDYGNGRYFMVWFDNRSGNYDVYGSRVSSGGSLSDGSGLVISNATGDQKNPRLTDRDPYSGLGNYVLSWIDLRNGQADIYGALINEVGTKAGSDIQIAGGSYDQRAASIDVDWLRSGYAVVSWIDKRNGTDFDIYRAQVDQSGVVSGETLVSGAGTGAANNQVGPLVTYSDDYGTDNGFLIIWRDNRSGVDYDLYGSKAWP